MNAAPADRSPHTTPELQVLTGLFYDSLDELGQFREVVAHQLPDVPRKLLWHDAHMTVTLEAHFGCGMNVEVISTILTESHYSRHVLLRCQKANYVTQYGIVRLNLAFLDDEVRWEIESQQTPLGRVLITHDVLRKVRLLSLYDITPAAQLREFFGLDESAMCYGRTALIYCNDVPAVELLEIVSAV